MNLLKYWNLIWIQSNIWAKRVWNASYRIILIHMKINFLETFIKNVKTENESAEKKGIEPQKWLWPFMHHLWIYDLHIVLKWHAWQLHNLNHSTCYLLPLSGSFWEPLVWIGLDRDIIVVRRTVSARSAIWRLHSVASFILPKSAIFSLKMPW